MNMKKIIASLPERDARLVTRYSAGYSYNDIAHEEGITRQGVESALNRAKRAVFQKMVEEGIVAEAERHIAKGGRLAIYDGERISKEYCRFVLLALRFGLEYSTQIVDRRFLLVYGSPAFSRSEINTLGELCRGESRGIGKMARVHGLPLKVSHPYFGEAVGEHTVTAMRAAVEAGDFAAAVTNGELRCIPHYTLSSTLLAYRNMPLEEVYHFLYECRYCRALMENEAITSVDRFMRWVSTNYALRNHVERDKDRSEAFIWRWKEDGDVEKESE